MDWALSFTPNDIQDLTPRQAASRVNPKIVLSIRVGKGAVSKAIPVLLEDMSFTGRMRWVYEVLKMWLTKQNQAPIDDQLPTRQKGRNEFYREAHL
jgi:Ca2+-dependent lipid-binding protein